MSAWPWEIAGLGGQLSPRETAEHTWGWHPALWAWGTQYRLAEDPYPEWIQACLWIHMKTFLEITGSISGDV